MSECWCEKDMGDLSTCPSCGGEDIYDHSATHGTDLCGDTWHQIAVFMEQEER